MKKHCTQFPLSYNEYYTLKHYKTYTPCKPASSIVHCPPICKPEVETCVFTVTPCIDIMANHTICNEYKVDDIMAKLTSKVCNHCD